MSEDLFRSYTRSFEQRREAEMSISDFLTLCRDDPVAYATAHERLLTAIAPWLLELFGIGPISAAQLLVSWSHAGRIRSEAAFAALAGTNPIPASSGQVTRYRLNRGGDRQLNRALHTILLVRLRIDPDTRAYVARRTAEGKSRRDAKRCLRRIIARQLFRLLERYDQPGVEILRAA